MDRKKTTELLISVLIGIVLWFYLINTVNPQQTAQVRNIPVVISGEEALAERGLSIAGDLDYSVSLKITGARNDISKLQSSEFVASADIASLSKGNTSITVSVSGPRGITIDDIIGQKIDISVEDLVTELKPVHIVFTQSIEGCEETVFKYDKENINVSGAKSDVEKVKSINFEMSALLLEKDVRKSFELQGNAVDENGLHIQCVELADSKLNVDAALYEVKSVALKTDIVGIPMYGSESVENITLQSTMTIKGPSDILAQLSTINTEAINIDGIDRTTDYQLVPLLGDEIFASRTCPELNGTVKIYSNAKAMYEERMASDAAIELEGEPE